MARRLFVVIGLVCSQFAPASATTPGSQSAGIYRDGDTWTLRGEHAPLLEFFRFVMLETGKPILLSIRDAHKQPLSERTIGVVTDWPSMTFNVARMILETRGYEITETMSEDGTTPIIRVHELECRCRDENQKESDPVLLALRAMTLEHADPEWVAGALRDLLPAESDPRGTVMYANGVIFMCGPPDVVENLCAHVRRLDKPATPPRVVYGVLWGLSMALAAVVVAAFGRAARR